MLDDHSYQLNPILYRNPRGRFDVRLGMRASSPCGGEGKSRINLGPQSDAVFRTHTLTDLQM